MARMSPIKAIVLFFVCVLASSALSVEPAGAAQFNVDRTDDAPAATGCDDAVPNDCSLRGAILAANARREATTIMVPAGTYALSQVSSCTYRIRGNTNYFTTSQIPLCISGNVTIVGADAGTTTIDAGRVDRVLFVGADADATVTRVTIQNGQQTFSFDPAFGGGGINNQGKLTLVQSAVRANTGSSGAGIYDAGTLTVLRSTIATNIAAGTAAEGGGIETGAQAVLNVIDSTISDNGAYKNGGGIDNFEGAVTITGSTISGNHTDAFLGAGIASFGGNFAASLTIINSTISGNTSGSSGGGIYNSFLSTAHLNNVTITDNTGGAAARGTGGGVGNQGSFFLANTIIAGNRDISGQSPDCEARTAAVQLTSDGYNLIQNTANCVVGGDLTGNVIGQDPRLGGLTDNGGPTRTHSPSEDSPAIDAGHPAAPGSSATACAVTDQLGLLRLQGAACDIGAVERGKAFSLGRVVPANGGNTGFVTALVSGSGFRTGATVKLSRTGESDIVATPVKVDAGGSAIAVTFDLNGRSIGRWNLVVTNPDGASKALSGAFSVEEVAAPQLWVDVIGRLNRPGRVSVLTIAFGNRGNVDAVGVPMSLSIPAGYTPTRYFALTPPPPKPDQTRTDWSEVSPRVITDPQSNFVDVPLLLPVVPAGFTGTLQIGILQPVGAQDTYLLAAVGDPIANPQLDPDVVHGIAAGAQAYLQNAGVTVSPELASDLEGYAANQFLQVIDDGRRAFVAGLGTRPQVYSMAQLEFALVFFGATRAAQGAGSTQAKADAPPAGSGFLGSLFSWLTPSAARAQQQYCPVAPQKGVPLPPGCSGGGEPEPILPPEIPPPPGCNPKNPLTFMNCTLTPDHCEALGTHKVIRDDNGAPFCVPIKPPKNCPKIPLDNPLLATGNIACKPFPLRPKASVDPNDKAGPGGTSGTAVLQNAQALGYTVFFENLDTATAPAQAVVVTDPIDVSNVDLDTFSLGPISFGDVTLSPAPGVKEYSGGIDLRPDQNLIVTVHARLDERTGVVTWRFDSVDPDTLERTDDPDAGFLPPNTNPPAGEGRVAFTVRPKPGVPSGTQICNQASITFDSNQPIDTPRWCNTAESCGDGRVAGTEQCDDGTANGSVSSCCSPDCRIVTTGNCAANPTPTAIPSATPTSTPEPTSIATVGPTATNTPQPPATPTPVPTNTPTSMPTNIPTPLPTETAAPPPATATPTALPTTTMPSAKCSGTGHATLHGRVTSGYGHGIGDVTVNVDGLKCSTVINTNGGGNFQITRLAPGTYTVTLSKPGCVFSPHSTIVPVGHGHNEASFEASCSSATGAGYPVAERRGPPETGHRGGGHRPDFRIVKTLAGGNASALRQHDCHDGE